MENINLYAILERYGIDVFVPALLVSVAILVISKLFPSLEKKHDFVIRSVLSVVFYAVYIAVSEKDAAFLIEKSASILGASYLIRLPYKKDDNKDDGNIDNAENANDNDGNTNDAENANDNDGINGKNEIDGKDGYDTEEVSRSGDLSDSLLGGDREESDTDKADDTDNADETEKRA
ncbi:MAG: hypothetical protein PUH93_00910 [Clostridia bacterium]|nr:hypothetical protein [Clostridia bacterium]